MNYQHMEKKVVDLEYEVELLKQQKNDNYMIVTGIPENDQENTTKIIIEVAKKINVEIETRDLLDSRRLKSNRSPNTRSRKYPAPILVNFIHPIYKTRFMQAKKGMGKILTQQIYPDHDKEEDMINFRSFLTPSNIDLLQYAKVLKKFGYTYIWFSQNKIQVRKGPNTQIIHIKTKSDVDNLTKN